MATGIRGFATATGPLRCPLVLKEMKKKKRKQRRKVKYINVKKCNTGASTYYLIISRTSSMNTVKRLTNILGSFVSNL
jgi:hypothetical protein